MTLTAQYSITSSDDGGFFHETAYEYDRSGRVTEVAHTKDVETTSFAKYEYLYDQAHRIYAQTTTNATGITPIDGSYSESFSYHDAGQLESVGHPAGPQAYIYDDNGNRTVLVQQIPSWTFVRWF